MAHYVTASDPPAGQTTTGLKELKVFPRLYNFFRLENEQQQHKPS